MTFHFKGLTLILFWAFVVLCSFPTLASAECSDAKIKRLAREGNTVASIARTCNTGKQDVQSILADDGDDGGGDKSEGFPPGTPVGQCGCWGYTDPRVRQPMPQCQSGYASPRMCNAMCPAGGPRRSCRGRDRLFRRGAVRAGEGNRCRDPSPRPQRPGPSMCNGRASVGRCPQPSRVSPVRCLRLSC